MTGKQAVNVLKEGLGRKCVLERKIGVEGAGVEALYEFGVFENALDFARVYKVVSDLRVVHRFDSEEVARDEKRVVDRVVDRKAEHSAQARKQILLPLLKAVNQDLAVGVGVEPVTFGDKLLPELLIVIDLAVEGQNEGFVLIVNRLMTCVEVDDRQAAKAHRNSVVAEKAVGIGTAVSYYLGHFSDSFLAVVKLACKAADAAHIENPFQGLVFYHRIDIDSIRYTWLLYHITGINSTVIFTCKPFGRRRPEIAVCG